VGESRFTLRTSSRLLRGMKIPTNQICALVLSGFASVCLAQTPAKTPAEVAKAFSRAVWDGDKEAAKRLATKGTNFDGFPGKAKEGSAESAVISAAVEGDLATVVLDSPGSGRGTLKLVREDGAWKVDLKGTKNAGKGVAQATRAELDLENIATCLDLYRSLNGSYPTTQQGIGALVKRPVSEPLPRKWRQLMAEPPLDSWGTPFGYKHPATRSKKEYDLYSFGPDGKDGTGDEIGNW
jgi:type II secretion system protein G